MTWLDYFDDETTIKNLENSRQFTDAPPIAHSFWMTNKLSIVLTTIGVITLLTIFYKLRRNLNTPLKRVGFIALASGLIMLAVGLYLAISHSYYGVFDLDDYLEALTNHYSHKNGYRLIRYGTYLTILGSLLSYFYDKTMGKLIAWIIKG